jgi:hypothetical protein
MSHNRSKGILDVRWITALVMTAVLILGAVSMATATGSVGTAAGFEDDDGNMTQDSVWDWNSFAPITWDGTEPYRTSDHVDNGWTFKGIEDAVVTTSDTAFAGGTKQDDACPTVNTGKAPNKNDLQRIYLASKVVNDHTYLMLAWHRIPQNTTSSSAHIGFEFNKGNTPCPAGSDGLVERTAGDMLIVYDFEGSATDTPVLTMSRWTTSGACEVGSDSPPCWGTAINLTALGYAEGKVNTSDVGTITDQLSPSAPDATGLNEFGEAGIDLTAAGVFSAGTCESFGSAFGVSRSSGNSATAQMKDLVGPADFTIASCGTVITRKVTDPSGDATTSFGFTTNVANNPDTSPSPFSLKDGEHNDIFNVVADTSYNVTESDPSPNYKLTSIDCSASNTTSSYSTNTTTRAVTFDIAAGDILDCTFTNTLQRGAIKITKTSTKGGGGLDGATFSIVKGTPINGSPFTTANGGTICVDNLPFGDYSVTETGAPTGYKINDTSTHTVTVDNNAKCSDATYVGESISFDDTPLSKIQVIFTSLAGAGVTNASIVCQDSTPTVVPAVSENGDPDPAYDDTDETFTNLVPGTYTCTVVVDP